MTAKKALGRGLDALISGDVGGGEVPGGVRTIPLARIKPGSHQPRRHFDENKIEELAESIRENGLIQPIVVREREGDYQIIVGERRYRAALRAGIKEVPALIGEYSDDQSLQIALIENIQREDLNPIEESRAYKLILEGEKITQEELSRRVGKSRSYIANMVRLLDLPEHIQEHVSRGTISVGQAKAVVSLSKKKREELVQRIIREGLTVREVEKITKTRVPRGTKGTGKSTRDPAIDEIEDKLRTKFGTKVAVHYRGGRGSIKIEFYSDEELERLLEGLIS